MRSPRLTPELIAQYTRPGSWENRLVDSYLRCWAEVDGSRLGIVDRHGSWTYGQIDAMVNQAGRALQRRGIGPGDVVSWQLPNWVEAVVVHLAAMRIGAVSNPIVPIYRQREVGFILAQARSKVFVVPESFRRFRYVDMCEELRPTLPDLQHVLAVGDGPDSFRSALEAESAALLEVVANPNDVCLLLYTSGTTADPKGALHTHNTLDYENRSIIDFFSLDGDDIVFMPSPVAHITGVLYGMQMPFILGSSAVLAELWEPADALALIERWRCTFMLAATPFLRGIVDHPDLVKSDVSSLRTFACGGADVPPDLVVTAAKSLDCHVARVYGSTEYPTATCSRPGDEIEKCAHTDGHAIGEAKIKLAAPDVEDANTDSGELLLRGPELFLGYLDQSLNASSFDEDGWFATGDLARIDSDQFVTITGRKKDIIIRGGENISTKEVEDQLFAHPKIADVAVVGYPDPVLTERAAAVVVTHDGTTISRQDLFDWLRQRGIALQKIPERVLVVDDLPRTASGKIQKYKLREYVARNVEAVDREVPADGYQERA